MSYEGPLQIYHSFPDILSIIPNVHMKAKILL